MGLDSLEGDGISDTLLHWLHAKDELGYGPSLWLPDTVVYKFGQPVHWYFTSTVDSKLKKKNKQNLVNVRIEEAFNKRSAGCDLVAYYISEVALEGSAESDTTIEYFDRRGLHEFLYNRWKENNGILQRFVEPKGMHNAIIRAIWSPKVCLLEPRVNSKQLHDQRYGLYERAVTYEGPEHFSAAAPLRGSTLPSQVQRICENLVAHITEVSFQKHCIMRMVANFKVDSKGRIWFLWSSSIRLAGGRSQPRSITIDPFVEPNAISINSIVQLPPHIKLVDKANHSDDEAQALLCMHCISCGKSATSDQFHPIQYKTIVAHFEQLVAMLQTDGHGSVKWPPNPTIIAAAGGVGFGNLGALADRNRNEMRGADATMPPIIRQIHPKLSLDAYRKYRRDPLFMYKTVVVCEDCFLVYAELSSSPNASVVTRQCTGKQSPFVTSDNCFPWRQAEMVSHKLPRQLRMQSTQSKSVWMPNEAPSIPAPIYNSAKLALPPQQAEDESVGRILSIEDMVKQRGESSLYMHSPLVLCRGFVFPRSKKLTDC